MVQVKLLKNQSIIDQLIQSRSPFDLHHPPTPFHHGTTDTARSRVPHATYSTGACAHGLHRIFDVLDVRGVGGAEPGRHPVRPDGAGATEAKPRWGSHAGRTRCRFLQKPRWYQGETSLGIEFSRKRRGWDGHHRRSKRSTFVSTRDRCGCSLHSLPTEPPNWLGKANGGPSVNDRAK